MLFSEKIRQLWGRISPSKEKSETNASLSGTEPTAAFERFYQALEDHFRGSEDGIYTRMQDAYHYMQRTLGTIEAPILDIGCGRGEWLKVLKEHGLEARGIDTNRLLVASCQEKGFAVEQADVFNYLQSLPDHSLGFVSAFHVIEHLPVDSLLVFLQELSRVLKPGGQVWLETPNPENMLVAAYRFYLDPTHQRPLPPDLMKFMLDYHGFVGTRIHRLQPWPETFHVSNDSDVGRRFNEMVYGAQDYAVTGVKER